MSTFLSNVPIWVFPLFLLLLIIGLRASQARRIPLALVYVLPLLGLLAMNSLISLSPPAWIWPIAAISYGSGTGIGILLQRGWIISRTPQFVELKGEWVTVTAMMIVFIASFVNGFLTSVIPEVATSNVFAVAFTIVVCLPAGHFLGRAITTARAPASARA